MAGLGREAGAAGAGDRGGAAPHGTARDRAAARAADGLSDGARARRGGGLALHGWHYVIEDGEVHVFDVKSGQFLPRRNRRTAAQVRMRRMWTATGAGFGSRRA